MNEDALTILATALGRIADALTSMASSYQKVVDKKLNVYEEMVEEAKQEAQPTHAEVYSVEAKGVEVEDYEELSEKIEEEAETMAHGVSLATIKAALDSGNRNILKKTAMTLFKQGALPEAIVSKTPTKRIIRLLERYVEETIDVTASAVKGAVSGVAEGAKEAVADKADEFMALMNGTEAEEPKAEEPKATPKKRKAEPEAGASEEEHASFTSAIAELAGELIKAGLDKDVAKAEINKIINSRSSGLGTMGVAVEDYEEVLLLIRGLMSDINDGEDEDAEIEALLDKAVAEGYDRDEIAEWLHTVVRKHDSLADAIRYATKELEL